MCTVYATLRYCEDVFRKESVMKHLMRLRKLRDADPEFIRDYQFKAMKKLIAYAYENSAFYKEKFDAQGVKPEDVQSLEDFSQLECVTREDVQYRTEDMISKEFRKQDLLPGNSSGSTGQPITYYHDKQALSASKAAVLAGWELAGRRLGDKVITLWGNTQTVEREWSKPESRIKAKLYRNKRFPVDKFIDQSYSKEIAEVFAKQNGGYVFGYVNPIALIANYIKNNHILLKRKFDGIFTTAEKLYPHHREIMEEVLGPVYDCYGSREVQGFAYQCREQKGYHVIEPNLIFEADEFKAGTKEVIITDLWNYAWPLIRYKISDLIKGEFGTCDCGCTWKTFDTIVGRTWESIELPDGGVVFPLYWFTNLIHKYWGTFKQTQFARVAEDKLVYRVVLFEGRDYPYLEDIKRTGKEHLAKVGMKFDVEVVDSFPIGPSGKHRSIVDETK
jgi:phenylacetate-CoA ligase